MTTISATKPKSNDTPFSYAAAASGKSSVNKTTTSTQEAKVNGSASASPAGPRSKSPAAESTGASANGSSNANNSAEASGQSAPNASKGDQPSSTSSSTAADAPTTSDTKAQAADAEVSLDGNPKDTNEGSSTVGTEEGKSDMDSKAATEESEKEASKPKELVPAPVPTINIWTVRKEQALKSKPQAAHSSISLPTSPIGKSANEKSDTKNSGDRRTGKPSFGGFEADKDRPSSHATGSDRKDSVKDRRKVADSGKERTGGGAKDDSQRFGKPGARISKGPQEKLMSKEANSPLLPPPLADTTSWPTPENAQDEEKKERREREEKDKDKPVVTIGKTGKEKWVNVPVTPNIIYNTPLPTKGLRGGRLGGRGGGGVASERTGRIHPGANSGDKTSATTQRASSAEERDRGRTSYNQGEAKSGGRGGYQGARPRRSGSVGSNPQSKESVKPHPYEKRKDAEAQGALASTPAPTPTTREKITHPPRGSAPQMSTSTQTDKSSNIDTKKTPEDTASSRHPIAGSTNNYHNTGSSNNTFNNSYNSHHNGGGHYSAANRQDKAHQTQPYRRENTGQVEKPHYSSNNNNVGGGSYGNKYEGKYESKYGPRHENKYDNPVQESSYYKEGGYNSHSHRERGPGRGGFRGRGGGSGSNTFYPNHNNNHNPHGNSNGNSGHTQFGNGAQQQHLNRQGSASQLSSQYHQGSATTHSPQFPPQGGRGVSGGYRINQRSQSAPQQSQQQQQHHQQQQQQQQQQSQQSQQSQQPQQQQQQQGQQQQQQQQPQHQQYGRFSVQMPYQQMPFIQTQPYQQFYEFNNAAGVAPQISPMTPFMVNDQAMVLDLVSNQINYYFSVDNLCKDVFLRKHMDSQGFVPLQVISNFNRIKNLSTDFNILQAACEQAQNAEFRITPDGNAVVRAVSNPLNWVLDMDSRDPAAQNDGPNWKFRTQHQPQLQHQTQFPPQFGQFQPNNLGVHQPEFVPQAENNTLRQEQRRHKSLSSVAPTFVPSNPQGQGFEVDQAQKALAVNGDKLVVHQEDQFPDDKINLLVLIIRKYSEDISGKEKASFTNGSAEGVNEELRKFEDQLHRSTDADVKPNGELNSRGSQIRFCPSSPKPSISTTAPETTTHQANEVGWFVDPAIGENQKAFTTTYTYHPYMGFRADVLKRRDESGPSKTPELETLYRFFSHFLRQQFNNSMYEEFKSLAIEDFRSGVSMGLEYLFKFYEAKSLQGIAHDKIYKDFATLVSGKFQSFEFGLQKLKAVLESNEISGKPKEKLRSELDQSTMQALSNLKITV